MNLSLTQIDERHRQIQLESRAMKQYVDDLKKQIADLKDQVQQKNKAIIYCKELLMAKGVRDQAYERIRQLEMGSIRLRG